MAFTLQSASIDCYALIIRVGSQLHVIYSNMTKLGYLQAIYHIKLFLMKNLQAASTQCPLKWMELTI